MTNEEIRIAVAEEMGFEHMPNAAGLMWNHKANKAVITPGSEVEKARIRMKMPCIAGEHTLPNYPESLDACAEFEKTLPMDDLDEYAGILDGVMDRAKRKFNGMSWRAHRNSPSAHQRCEAFLRLRNRWKD